MLSRLLVTTALFLLERVVLQLVSAKLRSSESYQAGMGLDSWMPQLAGMLLAAKDGPKGSGAAEHS